MVFKCKGLSVLTAFWDLLYYYDYTINLVVVLSQVLLQLIRSYSHYLLIRSLKGVFRKVFQFFVIPAIGTSGQWGHFDSSLNCFPLIYLSKQFLKRSKISYILIQLNKILTFMFRYFQF